ncbi:MAG TPA: group II intron maturase-specific domain-containing protein [Candidatus Saccharimonadales bacterium]|nr:group II intron maturase-specific domain-containing protein [Candidatus Saccharimonadales bacterium]
MPASLRSDPGRLAPEQAAGIPPDWVAEIAGICSFLPAISASAATAIRQTIREWRMAATRNNQSLEDLARLVNPVVRGWLNYYGRFYRSKCVQVLRHLNEALAAWARRKYKRFWRRECASMHWLSHIARRDPHLFVW